ncbi:MAG: helix-turn-helix domain-containing protein [Thermosipho sp. (in: Bacteria)]|nr:helix-turn-helix domain-containing protein [Thermosipho sp. (in: thermotogales)]
MLNKAKLRSFMAEHKITNKKLAEELGTNPQYISDLKNKQGINCSIEFLARLIVALNKLADEEITANDLILIERGEEDG